MWNLTHFSAWLRLQESTYGSASLKSCIYKDIVLIDYPGKCYNDITSEHISIVMSVFLFDIDSLQILDFLSFFGTAHLCSSCMRTLFVLSSYRLPSVLKEQ